MPVLVEQLIYTSFPRIGFKCFASEKVPLAIQQVFCEKIVHQHWDNYNPPPLGTRAAYLYQFSHNQILFGWLYNDETDDFGRANIPYFVCYYLSETVNPFQLDKIFNCLETGPINLIDRHSPPDSLENLLIPDFCLYEAARKGVSLSQEVREQYHYHLEQKILINLFIVAENILATIPTNETKAISPATVLDLPPESEPVTYNASPSAPLIQQLEIILQEFAAKPIGIQGVVLVSLEGHPLTSPIGIDYNSALIMAGTMLYLAKSTQEEFNWQRVENISVRGQQGHVILAACSPEVFLLVKAGKAVTGLLEGEINRTVKKLKPLLKPPEVISSPPSQPLPELTTTNNSQQEEFPSPNFHESARSNNQASEEIIAETNPDTKQQIRYRGRRIG